MMTKKVIGTLMVAGMVMATAMAAHADEGKLTIGYAPATLNNAFWGACEDGVNKAIEELGIEAEVVEIDANGDQALMNDGIANLLNSGVDAILMAPADSNAVGDVLNQCEQAGIPVINFDTPVPEEQRDQVVTVIASDNYNAGYVVGKDAASKVEKGAKVLVLHSPRASACVERYNGFVDAMNEGLGEDGWVEVNNLDGQGATEPSMNLVNDALVADPDLSIIFAVNDPSAMGATQAIAQATVELTNDILVYGVDGNPDAKKQVEQGIMAGTGSQSPETLGYESMMAAYKTLQGEEVEKEIVVDTFLITAENVADFGTDGWQ